MRPKAKEREKIRRLRSTNSAWNLFSGVILLGLEFCNGLKKFTVRAKEEERIGNVTMERTPLMLIRNAYSPIIYSLWLLRKKLMHFEWGRLKRQRRWEIRGSDVGAGADDVRGGDGETEGVGFEGGVGGGELADGLAGGGTVAADYSQKEEW
nr:uncharacterized protein LOC109155727 isoform X2 [Ipomoea batatas]